ncbi:SIR2 family protein [Sphingomonas sp. MA1305]|jgi:hypothetical protein|uniref:SIR2 family protein n=1 Tax=Sphingomonas sp. MA1305 TaxID=2479204 RepID=UPI0018DF9CD6|nr:SIR2 family protein [Sphingomonas sp. MA1305]
MSAAQFATAFALRPQLISWFLGAGASAASGIPTGYAMITDFKAQIFCRENNLSKREIDTGDPVWIERISSFFRTSSLLPPDGDPSEYAAAFEAIYPQPRHRRQYIDDAISKGTPCFGHKVLGSLIAAGQVDCIFTTNFDPLAEEAATSANAVLPPAEQHRATVAAIDSADRAMRSVNESDWPLIAKLHGDYQSIAIKNTGSELEQQDARMRHVLEEAGKRFGMVFIGYSGRDASILEVLNAVLKSPSPFPSGLYWVASSAEHLLPKVVELLTRAVEVGVDVAVVECATFDELAAALTKAIDLPQPLYDYAMVGRPAPRLVPVQPPSAEARRFPVLRYSALLIEAMPLVARRVRLTQATTSPEVRGLFKSAGVRATAAAMGRELAVFGRDQDILNALAQLGATLAGTIELDPARESWAAGLVYDTLVRALARRRPLIPRLRRSGHSIIVAPPRADERPDQTARRESSLRALKDAYGTTLTGTVPKLMFPFQEGISLKLDQIDGRWWCGFEPYTFVELPMRERPPAGSEDRSSSEDEYDPLSGRNDRGGDPAGDWRRERWAQRYNSTWARIIGAWAHLLTGPSGSPRRAFDLDDGTGVDATFNLASVTGWSRPGHHHVYFDRSR